MLFQQFLHSSVVVDAIAIICQIERKINKLKYIYIYIWFSRYSMVFMEHQLTFCHKVFSAQFSSQFKENENWGLGLVVMVLRGSQGKLSNQKCFTVLIDLFMTVRVYCLLAIYFTAAFEIGKKSRYSVFAGYNLITYHRYSSSLKWYDYLILYHSQATYNYTQWCHPDEDVDEVPF